MMLGCPYGTNVYQGQTKVNTIINAYGIPELKLSFFNLKNKTFFVIYLPRE